MDEITKGRNSGITGTTTGHHFGAAYPMCAECHPGKFVASCSCGWEGTPTQGIASAHTQLQRHKDGAYEPRQGLSSAHGGPCDTAPDQPTGDDEVAVDCEDGTCSCGTPDQPIQEGD